MATNDERHELVQLVPDEEAVALARANLEAFLSGEITRSGTTGRGFVELYVELAEACGSVERAETEFNSLAGIRVDPTDGQILHLNLVEGPDGKA